MLCKFTIVLIANLHSMSMLSFATELPAKVSYQGAHIRFKALFTIDQHKNWNCLNVSIRLGRKSFQTFGAHTKLSAYICGQFVFIWRKLLTGSCLCLSEDRQLEQNRAGITLYRCSCKQGLSLCWWDMYIYMVSFYVNNLQGRNTIAGTTRSPHF